MSRSLERALDIIEAMSHGPLPISVIAERVGLSPGTCHALLAKLIKRGYVDHPAYGFYALSSKGEGFAQPPKPPSPPPARQPRQGQSPWR